MPPALRSASIPRHTGGADPQESPKATQNQLEAAAVHGTGLEVPAAAFSWPWLQASCGSQLCAEPHVSTGPRFIFPHLP